MKKKYPDPPNTVGNRGSMVFPPNGREEKFSVEAEVKHISHDFPDCCLYVQKLKFDNGTEELRFCYYRIGVQEHGKDSWLWGESCPSFPKEDFNAIIIKAQAAGLL